MKHPSDEIVIAYIYGEAPPADAAELERHCAQCHDCAQKIDGIKRTLFDLDSMADDGPPEYLTDKLNDFMARVAEIEGGPAENTSSENISSDDGRRAGREAKGESEIMTPAQLAAYLKIPVDSVYSMLGELPHVILAGAVRFRRSSIEKWLDSRERNRPSPYARARDIENPLKLWRTVI